MYRAYDTRLGKRVGRRPVTKVAGQTYRNGEDLTCRTVPKAAEGSKRRHIVVADDHPLFRYGLRKFFDTQRDLISADEADSARSLKTALAARLPDLLVMDLRFPDADGIELIKTLRAAYSALPILVLSGLEETIYAERAMRAGALGFVRKHEPLAELLVAVRCVLAGELYLSRKMSALLLQQTLRSRERNGGEGFEVLSDREMSVFQLLGAGLTSRKVATQLGISLKTVESHRENIKYKLGFGDGAELVRHAVAFVDGSCAVSQDRSGSRQVKVR